MMTMQNAAAFFVDGDPFLKISSHLSDQTWLVMSTQRPDIFDMWMDSVFDEAIDMAAKRHRKPVGHVDPPAVEPLPQGITCVTWTFETAPIRHLQAVLDSE